MRRHRPPERFGLPPNYRWVHGQPPDPPPDIFSGTPPFMSMETYGGYLSAYPNISHPKSNCFTHDFTPKAVESCLLPLFFRKPTYYLN